MSNLGAYITMTTMAKKVGGPVRLLTVALIGGYAVGRSVEAAGKKAFSAKKAVIKKRSEPCAAKGLLFEVVADGEDDNGLKLRTGDQYRVLECDGDPILIEILGDTDNPYSVSSEFLTTISDFPAVEAAEGG